MAQTEEARRCEGWAPSKVSRHTIPLKANCRSTKKLGRMFVDPSLLRDVAALRKKCYVVPFCDDFSRFMLVYFLVSKGYVDIGTILG